MGWSWCVQMRPMWLQSSKPLVPPWGMACDRKEAIMAFLSEKKNLREARITSETFYWGVPGVPRCSRHGCKVPISWCHPEVCRVTGKGWKWHFWAKKCPFYPCRSHAIPQGSTPGGWNFAAILATSGHTSYTPIERFRTYGASLGNFFAKNAAFKPFWRHLALMGVPRVLR